MAALARQSEIHNWIDVFPSCPLDEGESIPAQADALPTVIGARIDKSCYVAQFNALREL